MGAAIAEYYAKGRAARLRVFSSQFYEDEIPVDTLFRTLEDMPAQEQEALRLCRGRVLDVGAGSGCHSLELINRGMEVVAIDISTLSVDVMKQRGIDARVVDFFDKTFDEKFDTILMAMNGIGIVGRIERLPEFFMRLKQILAPGGQVLLDFMSSRTRTVPSTSTLPVPIMARLTTACNTAASRENPSTGSTSTLTPSPCMPMSMASCARSALTESTTTIWQD